MRMRALFAFMLSIAASGLLTIMAPQEAKSIPAFSRQTEKSCSTCHQALPKLNQTGQSFRMNGFRFPEDKEWSDIQDMKHVPVSTRIIVEAEYNNAGNSKPTSKLGVATIELMAGAPLGKTGIFSPYIDIGYANRTVAINQAYGQVNDLIGATGHGLLNLRFGQFDIALPFLSHSQRVMRQRYFAQSALGLLGARAQTVTPPGVAVADEAIEFYNTAVELNGQLVGDTLTHRYMVGVFQPQQLTEVNRLENPGVYATYALTLFDNYQIGAIYKRDVVNNPSVVIPDGRKALNKWGIAGEGKFGPLIVTAGYFRSASLDRRDFQNVLVEGLYIPNKTWSFGARWDHLMQQGAQSGSRTTAMIRYHITTSVYAQGEWRVTNSFNTGQFEPDSLQGRLFMNAGF
ncbi:hypothetical protein [Candidatus Nitrospira nitrificans]|uniref:Cytochrome c n=1 Tax=Candidatus Nitrospira nitrificans TaxID=1742973 RepID=A0A0S4L604_9BACT|nr:hypothetical protein [Candidatus Nitrospira nitrificans]CUS31318.1 exported hypothetical protein [Candidatus Nitrospira nitrificans]